MVEVFKTNIETVIEAGYIIEMLVDFFPGSKINFDLHDCDNILRVEGKDFSIDMVMSLLRKNGFYCEILE